jgi:hypothetical protein
MNAWHGVMSQDRVGLFILKIIHISISKVKSAFFVVSCYFQFGKKNCLHKRCILSTVPDSDLEPHYSRTYSNFHESFQATAMIVSWNKPRHLLSNRSSQQSVVFPFIRGHTNSALEAAPLNNQRIKDKALCTISGCQCLKSTVFWVITPCSSGTARYFRAELPSCFCVSCLSYFFFLKMEAMLFRNVGLFSKYMALSQETVFITVRAMRTSKRTCSRCNFSILGIFEDCITTIYLCPYSPCGPSPLFVS